MIKSYEAERFLKEKIKAKFYLLEGLKSFISTTEKEIADLEREYLIKYGKLYKND